MKDEIVHLNHALQQFMARLRAGEPLAPIDHAMATSLAWQLLAALHAQKPPVQIHGEPSLNGENDSPSRN